MEVVSWRILTAAKRWRAWNSLKTSEYAAYLELATAAWTDANLAGPFLAHPPRLHQSVFSASIRAFPEQGHYLESYALAVAQATATLERRFIVMV